MTNLYRLLCFFCFSLVTGACFATSYFVELTGSNSNPGSYFEPWLTIQYGIDQLQPGDVLYVRPGTYHEKLSIGVSGAPGQFIQITVLSDNVILDGTGITSQEAMIEITDQSYLFVSGFELRNNTMNDAQGILVEGNCQSVRLMWNKIHDIHFSADPTDVANENTNARGIIVYGTDPDHAISDLLITNNILHDCRLGYGEGIAVKGNVDGFTIEDNLVYDLTNSGIAAIGHEQTCPDPLLDQVRNGAILNNEVRNCHSPYAACAGIYIDGAKDTRILYNSVRDNAYGIGIGCGHPGKTAANITVRNNIIRNNTIAGMTFGGYDYPANSGKITDCSVYNNDFYKNDSLYGGNGELVISYAENCVIENNLFYTNDQLRAVTFADAAATTVSLNYNLYFTPGNYQGLLVRVANDGITLAQFQGLGQETNGLFADPGMTITNNDLSFKIPNYSLSPCVNAGNPSYQPLPGETDFFNNSRISPYANILRVDIGAAEMRHALGLDELETAVSSVFPNPASAAIGIQSGETWDTIEILDLTGQIVLTAEANGNPVSIAALQSGQYLVRCSNAIAVSYTTLIKL